MARLTSELILSLHDRVSGPARGVGQSLDRLDRRVRQTGIGNGRLTAQMVSGVARTEAAMLARGAAFAAPAAAAYAGAAAYRDFAQAEREMTRTGLKLGASRETMTEIRQEMEMIANKYAVPIQEVMASFDSLAESGFEFEEARQSLDGVVKATQGLGGSGQDTVNTFDAARKSINLAAADSEKFFDIIAAGGSMGKFEGSDLARYLPSLLPVVARQGYDGLEGAARLVGFLEVMRDFVGSSEEAATATQDIFEKISSPDVIKKFKKFGVNLEERLADARDNGEDVLGVLSKIIKEVTKGDATKLSQLFGDRDSRRAANVLLTQYDRVEDAQRKLLQNSGGTIRHNVEVVTEDAQAKIDKMSNSWERFKKSVGAGIAVGATPALDAITNAMSRGQEYDIAIAKQEAQGGSKEEARAEFDRRYGEVNPAFNRMNPLDQQERSKAFVEAMQSYGRGDTNSPYADLDRVLNSRKNGRFPGLQESRKRADAWAKQQAEARRGNIDGGDVRRGIPAPRFRPDDVPDHMSTAEQYQQYGRGRELGENFEKRPIADRVHRTREKIADEFFAQDAAERMPSADHLARRRKHAEESRRKTEDDPWISAPAIGLRVGPFTTDDASRRRADERWQQRQAAARKPSAAEAAVGIKPIEVPIVPKRDTSAIEAAIREIDQRLGELSSTAGQVVPGGNAAATVRAAADEMEALMQRRRELDAQLSQPVTAATPNVAAPLAAEGEAAKGVATTVAQSLMSLLSITAQPKVDPSSIRAAIGHARQLAAELQRIPGLADAAAQSTRAAGRVDYDGLHADTTHPGF